MKQRQRQKRYKERVDSEGQTEEKTGDSERDRQ